MNRRHAARVALAAAAALGIGLRLWLAIVSHGSNDIDHWHDFGKAILEHGLRWCYLHLPYFNHPPLIGWYAMAIAWAERALHVRFDLTFKLLPIAADAVTGWLLFRHWRREGFERGTLAVALFAVSLCSLLVTAYHGNTDSALAMLVMLSGLLFDAGQLALAGAALGAAINIKLVPVFLIPVLGLQLRTRREALQFFGALALAALPFLPLLLGIPTTFVKNAILYNSSANRWGIYGLFKMALETRHVAKVAAPMVDLYWRFGRYVMMASVIALGIAGRRLRRWSAAELVALGMIAFLVFTPGFGIQYTIYVLPALFAVSLARGAIYSTVAGLFALVVYLEFWTGEVPYHSVFVGHFTFIGTELGLCTWLYLCASAIALLRGRRSAAPPPRVLSESPP